MACLQAADILLPAKGIDINKWSVIACDQFTSQPEYWQQVEEYVGEAPSALRLIYPEVYLGVDDRIAYEHRIGEIQANMEKYLAEQVLTEQVHQGYVLTVRTTEAGARIGLVAALDLESYDFAKGTSAPVRATEETVASRIPVRVGIRKGALVESPHVMMLMDDGRHGILESLYQKRKELRRLYDLELMFGGGRLCGYAVEGTEAEALTERLLEAERDSGRLFLAVGDGNHSLATAKTCWELVKENLSSEEREGHPARYTLVEVVDLYSPALQFEAIHRVLFGVDMESVAKGLEEYLGNREVEIVVCPENKGAADITFVQRGQRVSWKLENVHGSLTVKLLQEFLDEYLRRHPEGKLDYVHSEQAVIRLSEEQNACGILLKDIDKSELFAAIHKGGTFPRKTFSIGEPVQKRYYMECRKLTK